MLCLGFIIGGFASGNNTIGTIGIIGAVGLIIYGLTTSYIKQKKSPEKCIFDYIDKVNKIKENIGATAFFTPAELASGIINLWDAKQNLTQEEYFYVQAFYEMFKMSKKELCLDHFGFLGACNEMIAHFDLIAPYYKFCGNDELQMARLVDDEKLEYRARAKSLLASDDSLLLGKEWMKLHKEFMEKFYS